MAANPLLTTEEITLRALQTEYARLVQVAAKAKSEADEYLSTGDEAIAIYREFAAIANSRAYNPRNTQKLEDLRKRQARVDRINKKDFLALMDRQHEAEWERDLAAQAIGGLEFQLSFRHKPAPKST